MANTNGNIYPTWLISNEFQVFGVDSNDQTHQASDTNFASDLGISEDGTLWAISTTPDPDGGGAKIYWSTGNGTWNEINTSDPGGVMISGGSGSSCYYITSEGIVRTLDTNGTSSVYYDTNPVFDFDYGGGYVWAILSIKAGNAPSLHYSESGSLSWKSFANDVVSASSLSVMYSGDCIAVSDFSPVTYSKDGSSVSSPGSGADGSTLQISSKNWTYLISTDENSSGNQIMVWVDTSGGVFQNLGTIRAMKVLSSYYMGA